MNCAVLQSVQGPVMRILRKGSCIAIDLPPITLTPSRTAAERQLVGEELDIEDDGWLIASARSISREEHMRESNASSVDFNSIQLFYRQIGVLDFYEPAIVRYRQIGLLGESHDGFLKMVPLQLLAGDKRRAYQDESKNARSVAEAVNRAREWIYKFREQGQLPVDRQDHLRGAAYKQAVPGVWVYTPVGKWIKLR